MRREEAEAEQERLQRDDHRARYIVREQRVGEWEVVRTNIPRPTSANVVAGRGAAPPTTDAEQAAELANARRLKALRERRARLANEEPVAPPEEPRPFIMPPGIG